MKCPHCGQALGERICPACASALLAESRFCHHCGLQLEKADPGASPVEEGEIDFTQRLLCSDGTCIGVVDQQGICKVCGKPYTGEAG
ncbi:MAG: zinc ribbon domain-containing protein [Deltaproteobacteria bacterium]|nr:zinc ribbon domain-containing protein [Deltaproteobacteria bacterium]